MCTSQVTQLDREQRTPSTTGFDPVDEVSVAREGDELARDVFNIDPILHEAQRVALGAIAEVRQDARVTVPSRVTPTTMASNTPISLFACIIKLTLEVIKRVRRLVCLQLLDKLLNELRRDLHRRELLSFVEL